ncbi:MAG: hypothetical protein QM731_03945 [Chitinophagaceae bacterium]
MITSTLIEIVFDGIYGKVNFEFLPQLLSGARDISLYDPEIPLPESLEDIVNVFDSNDYVDIVITTDQLNINDNIVKSGFINLGKNDENVELLLYFDLRELNEVIYKKEIEFLKKWVDEFVNTYRFQHFICKMDNAGEFEYYFDSNGWGPFYQDPDLNIGLE